MKYTHVLERADQFFRKTLAEQPRNLQCRRGCTLCCYGLFEIGAADVSVIAEGLQKLDDDARQRMVSRAARILQETGPPDLREATEEERDAYFVSTAAVPCPALGDAGECLIYAHRPMVCRTFGLPLRDGAKYLGEECDLNFTAATELQKRQAAWNLWWEDAVGDEDQFTVPEAIVLADRFLGKS